MIQSLQRGTLGFNCTGFHSLGNSREGDEHLIAASDAVFLMLRAGISCTEYAVREIFTGNDDATNARIRQLQGECTTCVLMIHKSLVNSEQCRVVEGKLRPWSRVDKSELSQLCLNSVPLP